MLGDLCGISHGLSSRFFKIGEAMIGVVDGAFPFPLRVFAFKVSKNSVIVRSGFPFLSLSIAHCFTCMYNSTGSFSFVNTSVKVKIVDR